MIERLKFLTLLRQIARAKSNSTIAGLQLGDYPCVHCCHVLPLSFAQSGHKVIIMNVVITSIIIIIIITIISIMIVITIITILLYTIVMLFFCHLPRVVTMPYVCFEQMNNFLNTDFNLTLKDLF